MTYGGATKRGVRGQGTKLGVKRLLPSDCRPSNQGLHILWLWGHIVLVADVPAASPMIRVSEHHVSPFPLD